MNSVLINVDQLIKINVNAFKTHYSQPVQILWKKSNLPMAKYNMLLYSVKEWKENSLYPACLLFFHISLSFLLAVRAWQLLLGAHLEQVMEEENGRTFPAGVLLPSTVSVITTVRTQGCLQECVEKGEAEKPIPGLETESPWSESFRGYTRPSLKISLHTLLSWEYK